MKLLSLFFPVILLAIVVLALPTPHRQANINFCSPTNSTCTEATTSSFSFRKTLQKTFRRHVKSMWSCPSDRRTTRLTPTSHILRSEIKAPTFSEVHPVDASLFGAPRNIAASPEDLKPYVHPRLFMNASDWNDIIDSYANPTVFNRAGSWSARQRLFSKNDVGSDAINKLITLERSGRTAAYDGRAYDPDSAEYANYREGLADLASTITHAGSHSLEKLPICILHSDVGRQRWARGHNDYFTPDTWRNCSTAALAWARVILAHHQFHCEPGHLRCTSRHTEWDERVRIWDTARTWGIQTDWFTGGLPLALSYDLLYDRLTEDERMTMRSAIALIVKGRIVWGAAKTSSPTSPNALTHPHRIFSNWAGYNGHLYVTNLAIEGEEKFDPYVTSVLRLEKLDTGFNKELHAKYSAVLKAWIEHSFYADGATFEDAYSYSNAMREGAFALLASERRGSRLLTRPRFRNIIHNFAQMVEPWHCGDFLGHGSGGGSHYNSHVALFRYVYPNGQLPGMLWRQRNGDNFENNKPCRIGWFQSGMQLLFLGGEHSSLAEAPQHLPPALKKHIPLSFYSSRRGILIARSTLSENATYIHFDCRPDAFLVGHDNADRGVFTYTVNRKTWIEDLPWNSNRDSIRHSLFHIDGLAQGEKTPSCNMTKVSDDSKIVIASGDLTYPYNTHWHPAGTRTRPYHIRYTTFDPETGTRYDHNLHYGEPERNSPWDLGWPKDDRAKDIGFFDGMTLSNTPQIGFAGLTLWKRQYRPHPLRRMTRSVALVREAWAGFIDGSSFVVVDSVDAGPGTHNFTSYLMLGPRVNVDRLASSCAGSQCRLLLRSGDKVLSLHAVSTKPALRYVADTFDNHKPRVRFMTEGDGHEELWMTFRAQNAVVKEAPRLMQRFGLPGFVGTRFGAMRVGSAFLGVFNGVLKDESARLRGMEPGRPWRLTAYRRRRLVSHHFTDDSAKFMLRVPEATHEFVGLVYGATTGKWGPGWRDVVDTCFLPVRSWVTVFDCGVKRGDRMARWKNRRCRPVVKGVDVQSCVSGGVRWSGHLDRFRAYYVVIAIVARARPVAVIQHQTVRGPAVTPVPLPEAPSLTVAPPLLRTIVMGKKYFFEAKDFETRKEHHFMRSDADGQVAVKFQAGGSELGETEDALMTCGDLTLAGVEISVLDCGEAEELSSRYEERRCEVIAQTSELDRCRGFRARIKVTLEEHRSYVAIVSAFNRGDGLVVSLRQVLSIM